MTLNTIFISRMRPRARPWSAPAAQAGLRAILLSAAVLAGCDHRAEVDAAAPIAGEQAGRDHREATALASTPASTPEAVQVQLLSVAFETASVIPAQPHIKDRSRAQELVVMACLELGQTQLALEQIPRIDNWRRGVGYAELAFHLARKGEADRARPYLDEAVKAAASAEDWRRDRIKAAIAKTHAWLGEAEKAANLETALTESEAGKVAGVRAMRAGDGDFEAQMAALEPLIATGSFDLLRNALESATQLFNRFYADAARRDQVQRKITESWTRLPLAIRIELLMSMAGFALEHRDQGKALELVNAAQTMLDGAQWTPTDQIQYAARLARLRHQAGDAAKARADVDAALALYEAQQEKIVNIDRAGALRWIAECHQAMGDSSKSLSVYRQAIEAGVVNPNSRPRAEDLSATCRSMALGQVEPDAALWSRIQQIRGELGPPW